MNHFRIRRAAPTLIAALCFLATVAGCQSHNRQGAPGGLQQPASASGTNLGQGLSIAMLTDASFNGMPASQVAVPRGWHVQGRMANLPCATIPSASWDAMSPDSHSQINVLPIFGWRWGMGSQNRNGCIPLSGPLHAADFLQKFAVRLKGVRVLGTMPVSDKFRSREENFTNNANNNNARLAGPLQARNLGDVAAVQAVDSTGHEMRLRAWVQCMDRLQGGSCFARVDILRAPKSQFNALVSFVDSHNLVQDRPTQQWQTAYMNRQQQIANRQMDQLRRNAAAGNEALAQQRRNAEGGSQMLHDQYVSSSARLKAEHEAGMEQLQSSTDSSMRNAQNSQDARTTAASDWVDYAGDQQTVSGANGTYKTSSQYSNVWSSPYGPPLSDGRTFGSTDKTVAPNSATDNTWTKDKKVHGNGKPF